jgi:hypothetical protein
MDVVYVQRVEKISLARDEMRSRRNRTTREARARRSYLSLASNANNMLHSQLSRTLLQDKLALHAKTVPSNGHDEPRRGCMSCIRSVEVYSREHGG